MRSIKFFNRFLTSDEIVRLLDYDGSREIY